MQHLLGCFHTRYLLQGWYSWEVFFSCFSIASRDTDWSSRCSLVFLQCFPNLLLLQSFGKDCSNTWMLGNVQIFLVPPSWQLFSCPLFLQQPPLCHQGVFHFNQQLTIVITVKQSVYLVLWIQSFNSFSYKVSFFCCGDINEKAHLFNKRARGVWILHKSREF